MSLNDVLYPVQVGHTYVLASSPYDGWAKIGRTAAGNNPRLRMRACQTGNPRKLTIRAVWDVDAEALLHHTYSDFRGMGEWFALPAAMLDYMGRCAHSKRPTVELLIEWPVRRIWETAGGRINGRRARSPEACARAFMARSVDVPGLDRPQTAHAEAA